MFPDIFTEMAVLLLLAAGVGAVGVRLRQPLIVAFIAVGILVGLCMANYTPLWKLKYFSGQKGLC